MPVSTCRGLAQRTRGAYAVASGCRPYGPGCGASGAELTRKRSAPRRVRSQRAVLRPRGVAAGMPLFVSNSLGTSTRKCKRAFWAAFESRTPCSSPHPKNCRMPYTLALATLDTALTRCRTRRRPPCCSQVGTWSSSPSGRLMATLTRPTM